LYLNNQGTRWVCYNQDGTKNKVSFTKDGIQYIRTPLYYEQGGNFALAAVKIKGKVYAIPDFEVITNEET
jgi:hypothetical protein